jgi:hypothetical protein
VDAGVLGLPDGNYMDKLFHDNKIKLLKGARWRRLDQSATLLPRTTCISRLA